MKPSKFLLYVFILCSLASSAQLMNVKKWRQSERDSLDKALEMFDEKQYLRALPIFESLLAQHPKEEFLKYSYAKCAMYRSDKHEDAYKYFTEVYSNNKKLPGIQYDMALVCLYNYKFDEAKEYIDQYAESRHADAEGKKNAEMVKRNIAYARYYLANPTNAKVTNMGGAINSEYDEYVPAITADESALIFTYAGAKSLGGRQNESLAPDQYGNFMEDIYISRKKNGVFQPAVPLDSLNTNGPNAAISLSEDGHVLFIYQDIGDGHGDIYQSILQGDHFSTPKKLRGEVNSYSWDGHCSLSPDGRTLYFSSERSGGFGGRDIYKATLSLPDSVWGNVMNLGDSINTPFDDDAPFIHADGITLYYSSKGKTSMGGYDIFHSVMRLEDSTFKKTENLGYPINSTADDIYFVLGATGTRGYYSSGKKEGKGMKDIYQVEPNFNWPKPALYLVKGNVRNAGQGIEADIKVEITSKNNQLYKALKSNSKTGEYLVTLPPGVSYQLTYMYKDLPAQRLLVDAVDLNSYKEKVNDVNFAEAPILASANTPLKKTETSAMAPAVVPSETLNTDVTPTIQPIAAVEKKAEKVKVEEESINHVQTRSTETVKETESVNLPKKTEPVAVKEKPAEAGSFGGLPMGNRSQSTSGSSSLGGLPMESRNRTQSAADFTARPVTSTPLKLSATAKEGSTVTKGTTNTSATDEFVPVNGPQAKALRYTEKYSSVSAEDMEFRVQVAAVRTDKNAVLPNQNLLGKVEKLNLNDGYTRITVGGSFKTLGEALEHNKRVVKAGQKEGFIIALYKGKRVSLDELESMGLLK